MLDIKLKIKPGHTSDRSWMKPSPMKQLFWNVTYNCNYGCGICFTDAGKPQCDELTTREAMEVIDRACEAGVKDLIISGGEPFMRKDMVEILAHMAGTGMAARIASNGSLLTDDLLRQLRQDTPTKSFQISIDTLEPDLYSEFHRAPSRLLRSALHAVSRIQEHGFHTTVSVRLTPATLPGIPRLLDRACVEGWHTVTIHWPMHTRRTADAFAQDADFLTLLEPVFEHFLALPQRWLIEMYVPWARYHPVARQLEKQIRVVYSGCGAGRDLLALNPCGWLSPCVCLDVPAAYVGNVRRDDLASVFQNAPICHMYRRPKEHGICAECPNVHTCGGGCRAAAFVLTGRLDAQDESCPVRRRRAARGTRLHEAS